MPFSAVDFLTDSDVEGVVPAASSKSSKPDGLLPPILDLSDESSSSHREGLKELGLKQQNRKRRRRKRKKCSEKPNFRTQFQDEKHIKMILSRRCKGCKRCCLAGFLKREKFKEVVDTRKFWAQLHKLDQDKFVSQPLFACLFLVLMGTGQICHPSLIAVDMFS